MQSSDNKKVVLVVGACALDRLLTVPTYPQPDNKVRTTAYHEMGGGNAANSATTMALLATASVFSQNICIQLLTKLGNDYIGKECKDELEKAGIHVPDFCVEEGTTTGFTTIIVSQKEHTRTCLFTSGTCGMLEPSDLGDMDALFQNVMHLHSDSRHTDASLALAKEAHRRGIPVSVDAEKDRHSASLDELLQLADIIFTNTRQLDDYLKRWTGELEEKHKRHALAEPVIKTSSGDTALLQTCASSTKPSHFFARWYESSERHKEVVITKGKMGALHVSCCQSGGVSGNTEISPSQEIVAVNDNDNNTVRVQQRVTETDPSETWRMEYKYKIHHAGVLSNAHIVDTTGAGDAFIGAYILAHHHSWSIPLGLSFGAWVGGTKLSGPGARSALPKGEDVDKLLGTSVEQVQESLRMLLKPFGA